MDSVWYAKNIVRCIENHSKNFCIFATLLHKKSPGLFIPGLGGCGGRTGIFYKNYIGRGLWRAMVGEANFAISFITSELNYQIYQMTENLDLTSVVTGYLKSIEQLIWTIIGLQDQKIFKIRSKPRGFVEFSLENESIIDNTLGSLEEVIKHNS